MTVALPSTHADARGTLRVVVEHRGLIEFGEPCTVGASWPTMWRIDRCDGDDVSLSFHMTAQQVVDRLATLRAEGAADITITDPNGDEMPEHMVVALAAIEGRPTD